MTLLSYLRRNIFWGLDFIKGRPIKNHYNEIEQILGNTNSQKSNEKQKKLLIDILNHAVNSTPFYSSIKSFSSLQDFPVINKNLIQENFDSFKSTTFLNKKKYKVSTSGSTGIPFHIFQNKTKRYRNTSDVIYFSQKGGYRIGENLYFLEAWKHIKNNTFKSRIKNLHYIDISNFEQPQIKSFLKKLNTKSNPKNIIGLPSALESICKYLDNYNYNPSKQTKINCIITVSEYLNNCVKTSLEKYFKAKVISRYSNEEMGILAQQSLNEQNNAFIFNWASYHLEILQMDSNEPSNLGELGRIVITDLFNFCMPLIRYDTGDIGAFELPQVQNNFYKLKTIEGRKMDVVYGTNGEFISPHLINNIFNKYFHLLKQYQFIQKGEKEYIIKLNTNDAFSLEQELIKDVKNDFGDDANIKIIYVNEIPTLSSGKRKKVLNTFHNN